MNVVIALDIVLKLKATLETNRLVSQGDLFTRRQTHTHKHCQTLESGRFVAESAMFEHIKDATRGFQIQNEAIISKPPMADSGWANGWGANSLPSKSIQRKVESERILHNV